MKQANLYFNYEICKQLHDEYRHLHNNSYVMLGDLHYFCKCQYKNVQF